jgi:glycosyltransferase involved in cell wall biosynthesis
MKIMIDLTSLADNFSGIERYAACLSREMILSSEDDFVLLFKNEVHKMFRIFSNNANVEMIVLDGCNKLIFNQIKLPIEMYKHKADRYLFMAFPVPILFFRKNIISTIHDICCWDCPETMNGMSKWYFRISHRFAVKKCKRIITISHFSQKRIEDKLHVSNGKICLIYCGVDNSFAKYVKDDNELKLVKEKYKLPEQYLLSLSTLEPRKNLELLVNAYRKLVLDDAYKIPLVLAGRKGWKMDRFFEEIEPSVKEKIIFTGFIEEKDLPAVYAGAKLFVFPSKYEGFGMPPLEAMACGTNVLSSNGTSLPEVLGDGANYFKNNNEMDLVNKIKETVDFEQDANVMKSQVEKFSWNREARKLLLALRWND